MEKTPAVKLMDLLNSPDPEKRAKGQRILERHPWINLEDAQTKATLNYPENPIWYLPAILLFLGVFGMLVYVLT